MTTEQTAQQLELAAQILRTRHPWECKFSANAFEKPVVSLITAICDEKEIRPILATPPDNRPLHNPDNLTAEAVGVGYRLALTGERIKPGVADFWNGLEWRPAVHEDVPNGTAFRLPISVPWPEPTDPYAELKAAHAAGKVIQVRRSDGSYLDIEPDETPAWGAPVDEYRIKPEEPALQLPPPPPGVQWIKGEWKSGDLPQGTRPLAVGEHVLAGDEWKTLCEGTWLATRIEEPCVGRAPTSPQIRRTTRPLTFTHAGKTWTYHRPGDPMPCDGERVLQILLSNGEANRDFARAKFWDWKSEDEESDVEIIGWRYADEKKTAPLGPEDVPPGSVFRSKDQPTTTFWTVSQVWEDGFYLRGDSMPWDTARERMQINRSLSKGQWNPDAWEPCSKTIPA